jgi:hypothetical protein
MAKRRINPADLPSNNRETSNAPPSPKAVVSGRTRDKRSLSHEVRVIINDLFTSVVVPSTKNMIYEFLSDGLRQMILGQTPPKNSRGLPGHRAYHSIYGGLANRSRPITSFGQRAGIPKQDPVYQDIFFDYEDEARLVLASMLERIAQYGRVSLGDMRHLCGLSSGAAYQRFGWTDLSGTDIVLTSDGWIITLPELQYK